MKRTKNIINHKSSGGMCITMKEMLVRANYKDCKVIIIDPQKEYESIATKHYGSRINPLEIGGDKNDE